MEAHSQEQKKRVCWCLSENIAKQQQLAASPPQSKVRPRQWLARLAASSQGPGSLSLRIALGTSLSSGLGSGQRALGREACARMSLPLGISLGLLSGFHIAWVGQQSQTEHDPSILHSSSVCSWQGLIWAGLPAAAGHVVPLRHWAYCARGSTLVFNAGPRQT